MRILNRPMFRYGGPIKEGVMHGMKNGGSMREAQQWNTVGSPVFPKDNSGRAKHILPAAAIMAGLGNLYRGYKAARYIAPHAATMGAKIKSAMLPTSRFMSMGPGKMFRAGAFAKQNPITAFTAASAIPQVGYAGAKIAKAAPGSIWEGTKRYADMVIPGDQSRWWKDKEPPKGVPLNPNLQNLPAKITKKEEKKIDKTIEQIAAEAKAGRTKKLNKYLDTMGYDKAKKTAMGDALIDASSIVQAGTEEGGSLKHANWSKMINQAIQATSKRLDKPDQIREAVGLMLTKAEIEKDMEDPQVKKLRALQIEQGEKALEEGFEKDMREFILARKEAPDKKQLERFARLTADEYGIGFTKISDDQITGETQEEKIQSVVTGDGIYMIGDAIIRVTDGVPKHIG